jgi:ABC-type Na+ transport system ATPase subunit NatA
MSTTADAVIHTQDLTKVYPGADFKAVDQLNLDVSAGEIFGLLGITVIGAVLRTRQSASLRAGHTQGHAFVDGYHAGLYLTIALLALGVVVSYATLRPRPAAGTQKTESAALAELTLVDEEAGELISE